MLEYFVFMSFLMAAFMFLYIDGVNTQNLIGRHSVSAHW